MSLLRQKPSNVLKELHMTANQYNWVQSSLYVSLNSLTISRFELVSNQEKI
jgi:hypothetical protein